MIEPASRSPRLPIAAFFCRTVTLLILLLITLPALGQDDGNTPAPTDPANVDVPVNGNQPQAGDPIEPAPEATETDTAVAPEAVAPRTEESDEPQTLSDKLNQALNASLGQVNGIIFKYLFFDVSFGAFEARFGDSAQVPFLVVFLAFGAVFFTFWNKFINLRAFMHSWQVVFGKYNRDTDEGDISPFRALTSALSATVGLGNIAGVAVAMVVGGPGALFWMMFLGFFGMCAKFHESTLAQLFRIKNPDGSISGGPMYYIDQGFKKIHPSLAIPGKALAIVFAVFCMLAALGGGNMFQANQAFEGFFSTFVQPQVAASEIDNLRPLVSVGFGLIMAVVVAIVVIGGITRIGAATSKIVPFMAGLYVAACLTIIFMNIEALPALLGEILTKAFSSEAAFGGIVGAMIQGFRRAAFSSEAGLGSSAIAHSAAQTDEPVREGLVASLEPFIDTIVICFLTGITVLITGAYQNAEGGSSVTLYAFSQAGPLQSWFPSVLSICIILFAFSTMISWCYYGERAWGYLFGIQSVLIFRLIFVLFTFFGSVASLGAVIDFSDAMLLSMALPNIIGGIILAPLVKRKLADYWRRYKAGDFDQPDTGPDQQGADI